MAGPITWRNVNGPSPAEASQALSAATNTGNSAFEVLGKLLNRSESIDATNVGVANENAKQGFLDEISKARTPAEMEALQRSGFLDEMRASLAPQVRGAVRGAEEARLTSLRQGEQAANTFADQQLDRIQAPIRDSILSLATQGRKDEAIAAIQANPGLRNAAELTKAIVAGERDLTRFGMDVRRDQAAAAAEQRAAAASNINLQTSQIQLDSAKQTAEDQKVNRSLTGEVGTLSRAYRDGVTASMREISAEADNIGDALGFKVPRNSDGTVNADRMTTYQRSEFDNYLKGAGKPTLSAITSSNTEAKARAKEQLLKTYKPEDVAKVDALMNTAFSTTPEAAIGNDAATIERNAKIQDAADAQAKSQFAGVATPGTASGLIDKAMESIGKIYQPGSWKHDTARKEVSKFLQTGGIVVTDEKGKPLLDEETKTPIRVLPSPETITTILAGANNRWYSPAGSDYVETALAEWAKNPENIAGARKLYNSDSIKKIRAVDKPPTK